MHVGPWCLRLRRSCHCPDALGGWRHQVGGAGKRCGMDRGEPHARPRNHRFYVQLLHGSCRDRRPPCGWNRDRPIVIA
uniref:Uncharacterized protein n=1 Tax=uncultured marine virus TaxID=186617 RepID=A0A0F7L9T1_9VIRU|nr:hypothetical protein [uncultured marine virus]